MRLTRAGEYGVRCVLYLAQQQPGAIGSRRAIAAAMGIPEQYLSKIAQQLARAGIIEIVQGSKGGFRLNGPPERITLLQVVEAIDGEIFLNDCILRPASCARVATCAVHQVWQRAREQLRRTLASANFADLAAQGSCLAELSLEGSEAQEASQS